MVFFALQRSGILWNWGFEPILQMMQIKKPQPMVWGLVRCTRREYSRLCRSPRWGRRRFALAMSRARRILSN